MKSRTVIFFSLSFFLIFVFATKHSKRNAVTDTDKLVYSVFKYDDRTTTLYLYETNNDEHTILFRDDGHLHFTSGPGGLVAFSTDWTWRNNGEIYILDTEELEQPPVNLSQETGMTGYPLGWSDDGNYLAFASEINGSEQQAIYVWDGTTIINITPGNIPGNPKTFYTSWGPDGQLAFTAWFEYGGPASEIYIWDGQTTFNLSQNIDAEDREPIWNNNGELVFASIGDDGYILLLWDGTSYNDGLPDVSSFTRIAPQLNIFSPFATWTADGFLAFEATNPTKGSSIQIYTQDGRSWSNISQLPDVNSITPQWSQDGYWAFVTWRQGRLYVRDELNNTVFETNGQSPAWSSGGSLIFCNRKGRGSWKLSRWDRASVSTLVQGDIIYAQWESGQSAICSNG